MESDRSRNRYHIDTLSRALSVLFAFTPNRREWTLDELTEHLGLNKTSLLRIVRTFQDEKLLVREADVYRLGPRVMSLSNTFLSTLSVHNAAVAPMAELADSTGETVSLAILDDLEVVYVAIEQTQREIGIQAEIGGRHPAHATALGKVLLAALDDDEVRQRLAGRQLRRLTHRTIVDPDQLQVTLETVREHGFATDDEERSIGVCCVAAPIYDHRGVASAALSVSGPIFRMTDATQLAVRRKVVAAARRISAELGFGEGVLSSM